MRTTDDFNYHRIEAMQKHIEKLEAKLRGAEDNLEWFESFADYIAEQHANEYNQACHFADENLELEDRVNYDQVRGTFKKNYILMLT
jgi:hypothetical protein